jgi:hypothetical protein
MFSIFILITPLLLQRGGALHIVRNNYSLNTLLFFKVHKLMITPLFKMQKYDAVVGDTTILANRSTYVDFTLPYSELGVSMVVLVKDNRRNNFWIFLKPLSWDLWLATFATFVFTGLVIWALEHRINNEFRGPPRQQLATIFWFSFSTLVFANSKLSSTLLTIFFFIQFHDNQ